MYYLLVMIVCITSCSAIPAIMYNNARYESNSFDWFSRNLTGIISRDQCTCHCYSDQWCTIASYSAVNQQCFLFSTQLSQGQLSIVPTSHQWSVFYFSNKTSPVLVRLTSTNEAVYGIWNTTAGGDSTPSSAGTNTGNYFPGEEPENAFDRSTYTKYMNFGVCSSSLMGYECGLNTGLYLTLQRNRSLLTSIRFCTAFDHEIRDPLTITIEGSNGPSYALTYGTSWTLIYNGSTNLQSITQRRQCGDNQTIPNNFWYSSYRILVTSKRNIDVGTQYSEIDLFGY